MQDTNIDDHIKDDSPSAPYTALSTIDNLAPAARWAKEESTIKKVLSETLPDMAFNKVKAITSVKAAWAMLKQIYKDRSKALTADLICRFRNKHCKEDESICTHFEAL